MHHSQFILLVIVAIAVGFVSSLPIDEEIQFEQFNNLESRSRKQPVKNVATNPSSPSSNVVVDGSAQYTGSCSSSTCSWNGIRYAKPPTGALRFAAAQDPGTPSGIIDATKFGSACLQSTGGSEDCLNLNIQRPSNVPLSTKLPVLIFVHGGGFQSGSATDQDTTPFVNSANQAGLPVVLITVNYRLGVFGFLGGSVMRSRQGKDVALNAAFTDVRQSISWIHSHVGAFGGDSSKITVWGQSAGSFATAAQLVGSPKNPLFSSVILESGSIGGVPIDPSSQKDSQFNAVSKAAGCSNAVDQISCLRNVDAAKLSSISNSQAQLMKSEATIPRGYFAWTAEQDGGPSMGGFFADRPSVLINQGAFANVPIIHGDCLDEGTRFTPTDAKDMATTADFIQKIWFPSFSPLLIPLLFEYPDTPDLGSPYDPRNGDFNTRFYPGADNQYKRIASIYGDIRFQSNRRFLLEAAAKRGTAAFSYIFAQSSQSDAVSLGVPHGSDQPFIFNTASNNPFGDSLTRQWASFATYQTPNHAGNGIPQWEQYTTSNQQNLFYANNSITMQADSFRSSAIAFLNHPDVLLATGR